MTTDPEAELYRAYAYTWAVIREFVNAFVQDGATVELSEWTVWSHPDVASYWDDDFNTYGQVGLEPSEYDAKMASDDPPDPRSLPFGPDLFQYTFNGYAGMCDGIAVLLHHWASLALFAWGEAMDGPLASFGVHRVPQEADDLAGEVAAEQLVFLGGRHLRFRLGRRDTDLESLELQERPGEPTDLSELTEQDQQTVLRAKGRRHCSCLACQLLVPGPEGVERFRRFVDGGTRLLSEHPRKVVCLWTANLLRPEPEFLRWLLSRMDRLAADEDDAFGSPFGLGRACYRLVIRNPGVFEVFAEGRNSTDQWQRVAFLIALRARWEADAVDRVVFLPLVISALTATRPEAVAAATLLVTLPPEDPIWQDPGISQVVRTTTLGPARGDEPDPAEPDLGGVRDRLLATLLAQAASRFWYLPELLPVAEAYRDRHPDGPAAKPARDFLAASAQADRARAEETLREWSPR